MKELEALVIQKHINNIRLAMRTINGSIERLQAFLIENQEIKVTV